MEIQIDKQGDLDSTVNVIVPKNKVDEQFDAFISDIKDSVQVKGFRKGQAPVDIIKKTMGPAVKAEVSARLAHIGTVEAINKHKLQIAGNPILIEADRASDKKKYVGTYHMDGSFSFTVECQLIPQLDPANYTEIPISNINFATTEGWIEAQITEAQFRYADRTRVDRPAQEGDEALIDFEGTIDGEVFDGGSSQGHLFVIGQGGFIDGFEEAFVGKSAGESFDVECVFPGNYHVKDLVDKNVKFHCSITIINELKPHPLDDSLAKVMSFATLDDFKKSLIDQASSNVAPARAAALTEIMDNIIAKNPFPIPTAWVQNEIAVTAQRLGMKGLPSDPDERKELNMIAERIVRQSFILDKIYEKEKEIHLKAEDVQKLLLQEGTKSGQTPDDYLSSLKRTGKYEGFMSYHEQQRTIDFLIERSVPKEK